MLDLFPLQEGCTLLNPIPFLASDSSMQLAEKQLTLCEGEVFFKEKQAGGPLILLIDL
jgi:hypothetical protein